MESEHLELWDAYARAVKERDALQSQLASQSAEIARFRAACEAALVTVCEAECSGPAPAQFGSHSSLCIQLREALAGTTSATKENHE